MSSFNFLRVALLCVTVPGLGFAQARPEAPASGGPEAASQRAVVLVMPPVVRVAGKSQGSFAGLSTAKLVERFAVSAHRRFVAAFQALMGSRVLSVEATTAALTTTVLTPAQAQTPAGVSRLAKTAKVDWVVSFDLGNGGILTATVADDEAKVLGKPHSVGDASRLSDATAEAVAKLVAADLGPVLGLDLTRAPTAGSAAAAVGAAATVSSRPGGSEREAPDLGSVELEAADGRVESTRKSPAWTPDPAHARAVVMVGPGAGFRDFSLTGSTADRLAELRTSPMVAVDVAARVAPLRFIAATANKRWSDLEVDVHYRRAFVKATAIEGPQTGTNCSMTDDDLGVRGTWRLKLGAGYLPSVGIALGWSQAQTRFDCELPLLSTAWRSFDAQFRLRQPLYRDAVALELSLGPRFAGVPADARSVLGLAGEAWVEVQPYSVLFVRTGGRFARLGATQEGLSVLDTRAFLALEIGAFL